MNLNTTSKLLGAIELNFLVSFVALQIFVGSTANLVVVVLFVSRRELRRRNSDLLILNLAVADFISLTTFLPWNAYLTRVGKGKHREYYTSLNTFCLFFSGTAVLTIALDRFIAVIYPLRYASFVTRTRTVLMIVGTWFVAVVLVIAHFFDALAARKHHHILDKSLSAVVLLTMVFVSSLYSIVFKAVQKQLSMRTGLNLKNRKSMPLSNREKQGSILLKSAVNTFIVVCLFYATYLPYAVLQMMSVSEFMAWRRLFSFIYINSCVNPYVYFFRMQRFRHALQHVFNKRRTREINASVVNRGSTTC